MTVSELIKRLKEMPQDLPVLHVWDGEARTEINHVWTVDGAVITADEGEVVYNPANRPMDADKKVEWWYTPITRSKNG